MRRLRLALILLGLTLAVPVMLLVARARDGERLERELSHQVVAARAFDEMERKLTSVLEHEEARPFEAYRRLATGSAEPDDEVPDFVIGHFQIDPDGSLQAAPGTEVGPLAREALANGFDGPRRSAPPATTLLRSDDEVFADADEVADAAPARDDAYDVISRLNLGQARRAERKQQVRQESISKLYGNEAEQVYERQVEAVARKRAAKPEAPLAEQVAEERAAPPSFRSSDAAPEASRAQAEPVAKARAAPPALPSSGAPSEAAGPPQGARAPDALLDMAEQRSISVALERDDAKEAADQPSDLDLLVAESFEAGPLPVLGRGGSARVVVPGGRVRVALDPMRGLPVAGDRLLLYRTVLVDELGYRQGALIDRGALARWLEAYVLERQGLGGLAALRFDVPIETTTWAPRGYMVFGHRFGEPFDAMAAQLALAPLPSRSGSSVFSIYALAGLLALVAAGGLLAVDRMVKVVVSFAERRSRFVASVSHELKTPLTAIRMYAEMLRDGLVRDDAKREEYYETITDESERLSRLIDNVLEFSKLERGRREIELSVGMVPEVLEEAASKLRPHVERQGFTLRVAAEPDLPAVRFDRDALLQVLFNLVDNAMKYARPATPAEVVLEAQTEGDRVLVGVRDYGPGVDRRHLGRIFDPFYRVEAELTRSAKGTGIGLALVKELGQAMGAAVSGANAEGGGFRVRLAFEPAKS